MVHGCIARVLILLLSPPHVGIGTVDLEGFDIMYADLAGDRALGVTNDIDRSGSILRLNLVIDSHLWDSLLSISELEVDVGRKGKTSHAHRQTLGLTPTFPPTLEVFRRADEDESML